MKFILKFMLKFISTFIFKSRGIHIDWIRDSPGERSIWVYIYKIHIFVHIHARMDVHMVWPVLIWSNIDMIGEGICGCMAAYSSAAHYALSTLLSWCMFACGGILDGGRLVEHSSWWLCLHIPGCGELAAMLTRANHGGNRTHVLHQGRLAQGVHAKHRSMFVWTFGLSSSRSVLRFPDSVRISSENVLQKCGADDSVCLGDFFPNSSPYSK